MDDDDSMIIAPLLGVSHVWYTRQTMTLPIILHVKGRKVETIALVDSGAAGIFIDRSFAKENKLELVPTPKRIAVYNVDGTENQDGSIDKKVIADLDVKGRKMKTQFLVTALGSQRVILVTLGSFMPAQRLTGRNENLRGGKQSRRLTFTKSCSKSKIK